MNVKKLFLFLSVLITVFLCGCGSQTDSIQQKTTPDSNNSDSTSQGIQDVPNISSQGDDDAIPVSKSTVFRRADFSTISAGTGFSMAVDKNGTLWGWGCNYGGEIGVGYGENSRYADRAYSFYVEDDLGLGIRSDKTYEYYDRPVEIMNDVVAVETGISPSIALGGGTTLALKKDGTLWGWGYNKEARLGSSTFSEDERSRYTPIMIFDRVVAMSMGRSVACAIRADHTLWAWKNDSLDGEPRIIAENVVSACAAYGEITFIKDDHTLWLKSDIQSSSVEQIADDAIEATPIEGGVMYLASDGILYGWGYSTSGLFTNEGSRESPIVIMKDVVSFSVAETPIEGVVVAITSDGILYGWGNNSSGQLGNNGGSDAEDERGNPIYTTPTIIDRNVCAASCGKFHTLILKTNGQLYACGVNQVGQLGIGRENGNMYDEESDTYAQTVPVKVMNDIMLPADNTALYDNGAVYSKWEGVYYGKKSDFKDCTMVVSYGMNDGNITCAISEEDDPSSWIDTYTLTIDPDNPNKAYADRSSSLVLEFNTEYIEVTAEYSETPHSRYYLSKAERDASAIGEIDLNDLLGTWTFHNKLGIISIFQVDDTYYLNFWYSHLGSPDDAYLRAPVQLTCQDGIATATYTDDNCGNSGAIHIFCDPYGKYFLSASVDGMDATSVNEGEYRFTGSMPALIVTNKELFRDDEVKSWSVFRFIDPKAIVQVPESTQIDFLLDKIFYNVSDNSEYLEFATQPNQGISFSIYNAAGVRFQGEVSMYDLQVEEDGIGMFSFSNVDENLVAVNVYCLYDGTCFVETSDSHYASAVFQ